MANEFTLTIPVTLLKGGALTGKTSGLVERIASLLAQGVSPEEVLVLVASPDAVAPFRALLAQVCGTCAEQVRVATPRELALDILADRNAIAFTGREARLLARYEESFLMEDMKVGGQRPKRIRELVNFLYRGWTELADRDPDWLIYKEEQETQDMLRGLLDSYRAYVEPEVANAACTWLEASAAALQKARVSHVLMDDAQLVSRASQRLGALLATESLTIAANPVAVATVFDSYPYPTGIDELTAAAPRVQETVLDRSALPKDTAAAVNALAAVAAGSGTDTGTDASAAAADNAVAITSNSDAPGFGILAAPDPREECLRVVSWVQGCLQAGIAASDIAVTVPNGTWERNVASALGAAGIPCERASAAGNIGGDIRYDDLSQTAQMACLMRLSANPADEPSLRAWCGFGEYLTCRGAFAQIFNLARTRHLTLADALAILDVLDAEGTASWPEEITLISEAQTVLDRYRKLTGHLAALAGLRGEAFLARIAELVAGEGATVPAAIAALAGDAGADADASQLADLMARRMHFPALSCENKVKLVPVARALGLHVQAIALCGMVNGFAPGHAAFDLTRVSPERAERMITAEARTIMGAVGKGERRCTLFWFKSLRGVDAERLDLKVERFTITEGVRMAQVSRSVILDRAGL